MTGVALVARGRFHRGIPDLTGLSEVLHFRFETAQYQGFVVQGSGVFGLTSK